MIRRTNASPIHRVSTGRGDPRPVAAGCRCLLAIHRALVVPPGPGHPGRDLATRNRESAVTPRTTVSWPPGPHEDP